MSKKILAFMFFTLILGLTGCNLPSLSGALNANQPTINRDAVDSYSAQFQMKFSGTKNWSYLLGTRKSPDLREISLHIEGVTGAQNPGDIRMVTDNQTTWMIGAGTDNQCVQYPNGKGMDPTYLYPEALVSFKELSGAFQKIGEEQILGDISAIHYRAAGVVSGPWRDANIDIWQEKGNGMLRQFTMTASGTDPYFGAGSGNLIAGYVAGPFDNGPISPVEGCEISVPVPDGISMFVRLPGMASFESKSGVAELVKYYQSALPPQNWAEKEPPAQANGDTILSYQRDAEGVEIHIQPSSSSGSAVKLLFIEGQ